MKSRFLAAALLGLAASLSACTYEKVPAGHVGVQVNLYGSDKGVDQNVVLGPGRYWLTWNQDLFLFPTFTQTKVWEDKEEIQFQDMDGLKLSSSIGMSYHIDQPKVPLVFQKYRKGIDEITDVYLRNMVRDGLNRQTSKMNAEQIYGVGKAPLLDATLKEVQQQVAPIGIEVENLYWIGGIELPENVKKAINNKITAVQDAQRRENEVASAKAEAQKEIAKAEGDAASTTLRAEADAKAIKLKSDALASSPKLVDLTIAEKWDGKLPVSMYGNSIPMLNIK